MKDKKPENNPIPQPPKDNTTPENSVFSPIPLKMTTYADQSSESRKVKDSTSDEN